MCVKFSLENLNAVLTPTLTHTYTYEISIIPRVSSDYC